MGKGDKRSRKGKVWKGSYGNTRRKKKGTKPAFVPKPKAKKVVAPVEASLEDIGALAGTDGATEVKAAKPKKAAAPKKPKGEGEKKAPAKKKTSTEDTATEE
jgi:ribosomal small subunit protein bTHX